MSLPLTLAGPCGGAGGGAMGVLVGTEALGIDGSTNDSVGLIVATKRVAVASGTVNQIRLRTSASQAGTATSIAVAIYTESAGEPAARIGPQSATLVSGLSALGVWLTFTGLNAPVVSGTAYWIAYLGLGGIARVSSHDADVGQFKDTGGGQTVLPDPWPGTSYTGEPTVNILGEAV